MCSSIELHGGNVREEGCARLWGSAGSLEVYVGVQRYGRNGYGRDRDRDREREKKRATNL